MEKFVGKMKTGLVKGKSASIPTSHIITPFVIVDGDGMDASPIYTFHLNGTDSLKFIGKIN
jgi:hypothetical protein